MRRKRRLVVGLVTLVALASGGTVICTPRLQKWLRPPVLVLPQADDVAEVRASLREFKEFGGMPAVPEFVVPAEDVPAVLDLLRPAEYNPEPWTLEHTPELGEVVITSKSGEEFRLRFYWTGKNPVMFTGGGTDQFYGKSVNSNGHPEGDGGLCLRTELQRVAEGINR